MGLSDCFCFPRRWFGRQTPRRPRSSRAEQTPSSRGSGKSNRMSVIRLNNTKASEQSKSNDSVFRLVLDSVTNSVSGGRRKDEPLESMSKWMERTADPQVVSREAVVLVLVGLPARGKSFLSGAVVRHLKLLGVRVRSFNAGELRRESGKAGIEASFFSASNAEAKQERERLAMLCCEQLLQWIRAAPAGTSSIGILDATNTTVARRQRVLETCYAAACQANEDNTDAAPLRVIFLESICTDERILKDNYQMKLSNDDYKGTEDSGAALTDFKNRVEAYEAQYEPLQESELDLFSGKNSDVAMPIGSVQIFDGGQKITCCRTGSSLVAAPMISLLHAMHLTRRLILLVPETDEHGRCLPAKDMAKLLTTIEQQEGRTIDVICGTSKHGVKIAQHLSGVRSEWSNTLKQRPRCVLNLRALQGRAAGSCDGSAMEENYADLVRRMRVEVILLLERLPRSVLVVSPGDDVRRVLLAHFCGCQEDSIADLDMPENGVLELLRDHKGYSCRELTLTGEERPETP